MPNQLIGVSPPQLGKAQDSKVDLKKDFNETSSSQYRTDFEKALKEKLALKEKEKENDSKANNSSEANLKEAQIKKDDKELKVEEKENKSSGGTKKKMTEKVDDQMVSKFMASTENEIETPESKKDLAEISESQPKNEVQDKSIAVQSSKVEPSKENLLLLALMQAKSGAQGSAHPESKVVVDSLPKDLLQKIKELENSNNKPKQNLSLDLVQQNVEYPDLTKLTNRINLEKLSDSKTFVNPRPIAPETGMTIPKTVQPALQPDDLIQKIKALEAAQVSPTDKAKIDLDLKHIQSSQPIATPHVSKEFNLEQELKAQVGFKPTADDNLQLKSLGGEKTIAANKVQDFQKSVYDQLQKDQVQNLDTHQPLAALQSNAKSFDEGHSQKHDDLSQKNLKADLMNPSEMQHSNQSHTDFKTHLANPASPIAEAHRAQQLEENHDKNIQEVMNQAQFLVKKGGGEMNVRMSPDGLAEVQLKVMLQDGKVNIEMHTQDKTVKKLMEDSLSELKSGLAAQHLSVEHVKINSVTATNTDNSAQFQSNENRGGSEQSQREFWTQFQDNLNQNNSRRSNYQLNANASAQDTIQTTSNDLSASLTPLRSFGGTKGSQVNRVA